ncbi:hypothetical protein XENTR_v10000375 [Xenopus tropicalis]|nr:hypothetical protein XENTR_v10000375 [Xenopus tropicalis]
MHMITFLNNSIFLSVCSQYESLYFQLILNVSYTFLCVLQGHHHRRGKVAVKMANITRVRFLYSSFLHIIPIVWLPM